MGPPLSLTVPPRLAIREFSDSFASFVRRLHPPGACHAADPPLLRTFSAPCRHRLGSTRGAAARRATPEPAPAAAAAGRTGGLGARRGALRQQSAGRSTTG